jgi:hypothetical protein
MPVSRASTAFLSLSVTAALVLPLRLMRLRLPRPSKPRLIAPMYPLSSG